jgi:phosphatidylglycerophosphatase A
MVNRCKLKDLIISENSSPLNPFHPAVLWGSVFGIGFAPRAPGTFGSLAALLVWWFFLSHLLWQVQIGIVALYFFASWWSAAAISRIYNTQDAQQIVSDEVAGMWLALIWVPRLWWLGIIVFVLFRLLDILKPGPIGWLDRNVHGGLGVMLDDLLAGAVLASAVLLASFLGLFETFV